MCVFLSLIEYIRVFVVVVVVSFKKCESEKESGKNRQRDRQRRIHLCVGSANRVWIKFTHKQFKNKISNAVVYKTKRKRKEEETKKNLNKMKNSTKNSSHIQWICESINAYFQNKTKHSKNSIKLFEFNLKKGNESCEKTTTITIKQASKHTNAHVFKQKNLNLEINRIQSNPNVNEINRQHGKSVELFESGWPCTGHCWNASCINQCCLCDCHLREFFGGWTQFHYECGDRWCTWTHHSSHLRRNFNIRLSWCCSISCRHFNGKFYLFLIVYFILEYLILITSNGQLRASTQMKRLRIWTQLFLLMGKKN